MKILYIDSSNGISGDMLVNGLSSLEGEAVTGLQEKEYGMEGNQETRRHDIKGARENHPAEMLQEKKGCEEEVHRQNHSRSYREVIEIIGEAARTQGGMAIAKEIYRVIAEAEAEVHGATLETVHFHEVGRDQAILNAINVGEKIHNAHFDKIYTTKIVDGKGFVRCSHGTIPVPVPAVRAIMRNCCLNFETSEVETELVTPSGLAMLVGVGAKGIEEIPKEAQFIGEGKGTRDTGREGLKVYIETR